MIMLALNLRRALALVFIPARDSDSEPIFPELAELLDASFVNRSILAANALFFTNLALQTLIVSLVVLCKWWSYEFEQCDELAEKQLWYEKRLRYLGLGLPRVGGDPTTRLLLELRSIGHTFDFIAMNFVLWSTNPFVGLLLCAVEGSAVYCLYPGHWSLLFIREFGIL